ncbi:MAG: adenine deaminase [Desulfovibrio sp.]|jgi:adenine deaminase|nr:adenine deaminase [Desulfovibrio sp.]
MDSTLKTDQDARADLRIDNARHVNVFTGEVEWTSLCVKDGLVLGFEPREAEEVLDAGGAYILPGLIDAHVHIESSLLTPERFAELVLPRGVTTVIADPHEIANVAGAAGLRYMIEASCGLPLDIRYMLPSCVPALPPEILNEGVSPLDAGALAPFYDEPGVLGLGEMMNVPGVLNADADVMAKLTEARRRGRVTDGHAPGLDGPDLERYVRAGIKTDHECTTVNEMHNRLRLGMYVALRQGSAARDLSLLLSGLTEGNARRCMFCSDDKHPADILCEGHIDASVRMAVASGIAPGTAVRMATLNAAECYALNDVGALAPGRRANMILVDSLRAFAARKVWSDGRLVAENGAMLAPVATTADSSNVRDSVRLAALPDNPEEVFALRVPSGKARVICLTPHSIVTRQETHAVKVDGDGRFVFDKNPGILKLAVLERHRASGRMGLGLLDKSYGLRDGAIALSIAHDAHNIVVAGDNDSDMLAAVRLVERMQGGIAMLAEGRELAALPLPVAGLMSDAPAHEVAETLQKMLDLAKSHYHISDKADAFMTLSFLALPVIPHLKLTTCGLFDVDKFQIVDIAAE